MMKIFRGCSTLNLRDRSNSNQTSFWDRITWISNSMPIWCAKSNNCDNGGRHYACKKNRPAIVIVVERASKIAIALRERRVSCVDIPWKRYLWKPAIREFPADLTIRKGQGKEKGTAGGRNQFEKKRSHCRLSADKISPAARWWTNIGRTCLIIFLETDRCCVSNFIPHNNKILALSSPSWFRQRRSYIYEISVCKSVLKSWWFFLNQFFLTYRFFIL